MDNYELECALTAQQEQNEIDLGLESLESILVNTAALESVANFFEANDETSDVDLALTDIIMDLATAQTDITSEELVPGLENYVGKSVSTENIRESIAKYYAAFVEFLKKVWNHLLTFYKNIFDSITPLKQKFEAVLKAVTDVKEDNFKHDTVLLGQSLERLMVSYKLPNTFSDIDKPLHKLNEICKEVFDNHSDVILGLSQDIIEANIRFSRSSSQILLEEVNGYVRNAINSMTKYFSIPVNANRQPENLNAVNYQTDVLFNNKAVYAYVPPKNEIDNLSHDNIQQAALLRKMFAVIADAGDKSVVLDSSLVDKHSLTAFSSTQTAALCVTSIYVLDTLLKFKEGQFKKIEKLRKDSEDSAKKYASVVAGNGKLSTDGKHQITDMQSMKTILGYHSSIARWSTEPFASLMTYSLTSLRSVYGVVLKQSKNLI